MEAKTIEVGSAQKLAPDLEPGNGEMENRGLARSRKCSKYLKAALARAITPLVRSYIRFLPAAFGKETIWNRIAVPYLTWRHYEFSAVTIFGSAITISDSRDQIQQRIYYFGVWEPSLTSWISQRLAPGDVFIDIGANIGYFSLLAAKRVGEKGKVVAIDASPRIFELLERNVAVNGATNIRSVNVAVSNKHETLMLYQGPLTNIGAATVVRESADLWQCVPSCEIAAKPLSAILSDDEITRARIIKIDVEGAEWQVAESLLPLLERCRQELEIVVEVTPEVLAARGRTLQQFLSLFSDAGFHAYQIANDQSDSRYLRSAAAKRPIRLRSAALVKQLDLVWSRVDADQL